MLLWSTKRRFIYGGGAVLFFLAVLFLLFLNFLYKIPTCSDSVKNGDELGVDCGGSCLNLCTTDTLTPVVLWSNIFNISGDVYSAVAYIENPNINSRNQTANYQFRIYDADNKLITIKEGVTSIPKNRKFVVFENGIILKNSKPKSADFKFTSFGQWQKDTTKDPEISLKYGTISGATSTPNLTGTIFNKSLNNISKIEVVVIVLDDKENAIGTSRTFIDNLQKNSSQDFVFTWQKPFTKEPSVINVIYRFVN
jgi:hypothetical protein